MPETPSSQKTYTLADFEYELPEDLIAQEPLPVRHESRLMVIDRSQGTIAHHTFSDLGSFLESGDVIVINDTKVIPARFFARRQTGGQVQLLLLRPEPTRPGLWHALASPIRKLKQGETLILEGEDARHDTVVVSAITSGPDGGKRLLVDLGSQARAYEILSGSGYAPLPPYIHRDAGEDKRRDDLHRYQTVFARAPGAVAAPTAGLHFSEPIMDGLRASGVEIASVTLHVGPGTFKPITTTVADHSVEAERFSIEEEAASCINRALAEGRRIIAVGTTSLRTLETAGSSGRLAAIDNAETSLYIKPGHRFAIAGGLITNFHLSRSSLLVLVAAFAGRDLIMSAYCEAVRERYRFFSYGDATLIL